MWNLRLRCHDNFEELGFAKGQSYWGKRVNQTWVVKNSDNQEYKFTTTGMDSVFVLDKVFKMALA